MLRRILLVNGLDLKRGDYELVAAGAGLQRVDSMKRGETFAAIINAPGKHPAAAHNSRACRRVEAIACRKQGRAQELRMDRDHRGFAEGRREGDHREAVLLRR